MVSKSAESKRIQADWQLWADEHIEFMEKLTVAQRVLVEGAVRFIIAMGKHSMMVRFAAFFLLHAHMGLTAEQVAVVVGRTARAMRTVKSLDARGMLDSIWAKLGRHRRPKLSPEHAGPIAQYLIQYPACTQAEMLDFIRESLGITVDKMTLWRFLGEYGLRILRSKHGKEAGGDELPFP